MNPAWTQPLADAIRAHPRIAFIGVGQELRGDDGAGLLAVDRLQAAFHARGPSAKDPFVLSVGPIPEGAAGPLRRYRPDLVVFFDAAVMGLEPGGVGWVDPAEAGGFSSSTHTFPLSEISAYLAAELHCRIIILGIQPQAVDFDTPLSAPVAQGVHAMADQIAAWFYSEPG